ncbi:haloacid dehalogenase [Mytilinidion resinicola]|uniref:Haloacid dehalogenase n=1 Tax=Mytilinidion resinicola TaxID=574789 RepID=A0A6A6Z5S0_9PEZI|nr:haloacid dehalogenase [Mytilinidion resinicola]KAF2815555.1 haloacid dehalogenase [Mytilinidion resinicola]
MGTCCDWLSSLLPLLSSLPSHPCLLPATTALPQLAAAWRAGFFTEIHHRFENKLPAEHIDVTHRRVLDQLLAERGVGLDVWDEEVRQRLVKGWHEQKGWPDALPALEKLRKKFFVVVLANGTTRLQLDIAKSSGLPFHMLFSSELLGLTKPDPEIYWKALRLMGVEPHNAMMVAAHAYDLRAAKTIGLETAYIYRSTEDLDEDMQAVKRDVDIFLDGRNGTLDCGLGALADHLDA